MDVTDYDLVKETPLERATTLSEQLNNNVLLKREDTTPVRSFKLRGAYNKMVHLGAEELSRGVVACSAGNHAQGVAMSASHLGCRAVIVMPGVCPARVRASVGEKGRHQRTQIRKLEGGEPVPRPRESLYSWYQPGRRYRDEGLIPQLLPLRGKSTWGRLHLAIPSLS